MSELLQLQFEFAFQISELIRFAYVNGYHLTVGDFYRDPRCNYGSPRTLHRMRLAADLNLFKGETWLTDTQDHLPLGEFWESRGGSWGGRFKRADGNHYSIAYGGYR